jgi:putative hydrolase of the HAD superfamily
MSIRAVIFDFGRVICDFDIGKFVARAAAHSSLSPQALKETMGQSEAAAVRYETGLISSQEFYRSVCAIASLTMTEQEFVSAYTDIFTPKPATIGLVKRLRGHYRLGLLSNTNEWHFEFGIKPVGLLPFFDAVTLSYEARAMKPDPRIYADMLGKLALPAESCVYIDDIQEYVEGGRRVGLNAIHYTTHERLLDDLKNAGIQIPPQ